MKLKTLVLACLAGAVAWGVLAAWVVFCLRNLLGD